jgi:hypothetical protein
VGEARPLELREHPEEPAGSHLGDAAIVRDGAAVRVASERDGSRTAADRDPSVIGRTQVVEPLPPSPIPTYDVQPIASRRSGIGSVTTT